MVFTDPSTRIRTRSIPPVPLPVLHLPETLSSDFNESKVFDDFWDMKSTAPVLLKRSDKKLSKIRPSERQKTQAKPPPMDFSTLPVLDQMLLQQGLLNSPISIHLTSLLAESSQSLLSTTTRATRRRSSSDSVYSSSLICLPSAGPFTPELVINHVGKTTPEFSADYFVHTEQKSCLPVVTSTDPSDSPQSIDSAKIAWVNNSPNPSLRAVKLSASTSHRCLKRRGLIPSNQPITSQLLQSVMSTSTSDLGCHTETKDSSPAFKLQPALSAEISVWTDDSDKRSTLRPKNPITRQPLATIDQTCHSQCQVMEGKLDKQTSNHASLPSWSLFVLVVPIPILHLFPINAILNSDVMNFSWHQSSSAPFSFQSDQLVLCVCSYHLVFYFSSSSAALSCRVVVQLASFLSIVLLTILFHSLMI
ncbi:hypothetical protein PSTT_06277 [Puccinia striiformis]|uniref:Uncharacterized protein n=1 Tax=Puccinia striiformis TaxID=27350 RepID=A0A2S4VKY9_9BASI|nr:hypothetical protein PSTT_06277 [Puccinia striiformis]